MSKLRQRTKKLILSGMIGALVMGILASIIAIYIFNKQAKDHQLLRIAYERELNEIKENIYDQQSLLQKVVVTSRKVPAGVTLTKDDLKIIQIPDTQSPDNIIHTQDELVGKIMKLEVGLNTPIIHSMVFEEGITPQDLRAQEYNVMQLPTTIRKGQFVDVRISFPTGEDFIVLSKKKVNNVSGTTVWYNVNESEILAMSSAMVDAYLNSAKIYANTYVDPYIQEKAIINYPLKVEVINLIESNPNILLKAREQLQMAARKNLELNLSKMNETDKMQVKNNSMLLPPKEDIIQPYNQSNNQAITESDNRDVFDQQLIK
ncbi:SAF domain-containing protein [Paenibacillus sp. CMAA1364]